MNKERKGNDRLTIEFSMFVIKSIPCLTFLTLPTFFHRSVRLNSVLTRGIKKALSALILKYMMKRIFLIWMKPILCLSVAASKEAMVITLHTVPGLMRYAGSFTIYF